MLFERIKLEENEQILRIVRKHWWIICTNVAATVFFALLPLLLLLAAGWWIPAIDVYELIVQPYLAEFVFGYLLWLLVNWMAIANFWTDHYLDLWAITNRRIVSIDQRGFFRRFLSSFRLERLQDMNISVSGVIPTLLNFGTIEAQTAGGSNEEFKTEKMPDPRGLKALIIRAADERQRVVGGMQALKQDGTL